MTAWDHSLIPSVIGNIHDFVMMNLILWELIRDNDLILVLPILIHTITLFKVQAMVREPVWRKSTREPILFTPNSPIVLRIGPLPYTVALDTLLSACLKLD